MKMHRSTTVTPASVIFTLWIAGWAIDVIPSEVDQHSGFWWYLGFFFFAAFIRVMILCWQTLSHAVKYAAPDSRMAWVVGHIFLGPIVSVPYYYKNRMPLMTAAPKLDHSRKAPGVSP
jgi:uncharacterized membrane protein